MDIVGIDISKARFDAALLIGERVRHAAFSNTEAGFGQLLTWLAKQRSDPTAPLHACLEATGNWGLDLAAFLHGTGVQVSVVNPARIKAYGDSELARNKTDQLAAATRSPRDPRSRDTVRRAPLRSWSAAATCSKPPASKSSTVTSPVSPRPP